MKNNIIRKFSIENIRIFSVINAIYIWKFFRVEIYNKISIFRNSKILYGVVKSELHVWLKYF